MFGIQDFYEPIVKLSKDFNLSQFGDALIFGGAILLIGMLTIFSVLCILWLFLVIFKLVFHDIPKKRSEKKALAPAAESETSSEIAVSDDGELIAVISAAIAMAESDDSGTKFRVVSFKRT